VFYERSRKKRIVEKGVSVLSFIGEMTIDSIKEIKEAILDEFDGNYIVLDLNQVKDIDLPAIQLLYSAYRTALKKKMKFTVSGKSNLLVMKKNCFQFSFFRKKKRPKGALNDRYAEF